jgi:hypothetical protein
MGVAAGFGVAVAGGGVTDGDGTVVHVAVPVEVGGMGDEVAVQVEVTVGSAGVLVAGCVGLTVGVTLAGAS